MIISDLFSNYRSDSSAAREGRVHGVLSNVSLRWRAIAFCIFQGPRPCSINWIH